ncbi:VanZ family protein [Lachnoclostridium sp. An181]|uniref:VanZ family protein n=1 Tax=Lachnoclostridium sp. An181 TaxID=1965575 RepID=UPI001FA8C9FD|nr:VanZ family protein [Lachnoclostridium sp. An181]
MNTNRRKHMRMLGKLLFFLYVLFLIYFLLFSDWYGRSGELRDFRYNLELFKEIKRFWTYREQLGFFATFTNLIGNILIFVPFGFFLPMASKYRSFFSTLFYSFGVSLCVEIFQFFAKVGSFDVDDLFLNTVGGVAGFILFMICNTVRRRYDEKKRHG